MSTTVKQIRTVQVHAEKKDGSYKVTVDPWCVTLERRVLVGKSSEVRNYDQIQWTCNHSFCIHYKTPGHFKLKCPSSMGAGAASSGVPFRTAPAGTYGYTIEVFPEVNVSLVIDPDYELEEEEFEGG